MRGGDEAQPFLPGLLREQLVALNPGLLTPAAADEIVRRLRLVPSTLAGNEDYVRALRGNWTAYDKAHKRERNLTLIDYDDLPANRFHFTQEMHFTDLDRRRMDMVLWVNGLPVCVIENKSPTVPEAEFEAFDQIQHTYTDRIPEFIKSPPFLLPSTCVYTTAPPGTPTPKP